MPIIDITFNDAFTLSFQCFETTIAKRWLSLLRIAIDKHEIDDLNRFYGFSANDGELAIQRINDTVDTINKHRPIITRRMASLNDIDTLNYLHHIFETHHGLLDQQTDEFRSFPIEYQKALAQLNIDVHRCESVGRGGNKPRFVVTYFTQPKTEVMTDAELELLTPQYEFGTIYLNYVEIGKTLEDLARDNDVYISDDAFRPFINFSSDFNVKFWDADELKVTQLNTLMDEYYSAHRDFFISKGYDRNHLHLRAGSVPVAKLFTNITKINVLNQISANQVISAVNIR